MLTARLHYHIATRVSLMWSLRTLPHHLQIVYEADWASALIYRLMQNVISTRESAEGARSARRTCICDDLCTICEHMVPIQHNGILRRIPKTRKFITRTTIFEVIAAFCECSHPRERPKTLPTNCAVDGYSSCDRLL